MPLFELDESGSRLVRPMQPAATSFGPDSAELVTTHLSDLLGEGLFPVATRRTEDDERPHMLALDVVGQPVVVEVVAELNSESLIQALAYAGQAGRLTSGDLARLYHGGAEQFGVDLMAFRESLPAAYSRRGLRVGARLLLVCSSVHEEIADALEFLRAPGRQVEVLQMGVIHGAGGRRYLDVSPLAGPIAELRQVEQANLRLVRSDEAFAAAMAYDEQRKKFSRFAAAPDPEGAERVESPFAATGTDGRTATSEASPATGATAITAAERYQVPTSPSHASPVSPTARFSPPHEATPPTAETSGSPAAPQGFAPAAAPPAAAPTAPPAAAPPPQRTSVLGNTEAPARPAPPTPPVHAAPPAPPAPAPPAPAPRPAQPPQPDGAYVPTFVPSAPLIASDARPLTEEPDDEPHALGTPQGAPPASPPLGAQAAPPASAVPPVAPPTVGAPPVTHPPVATPSAPVVPHAPGLPPSAPTASHPPAAPATHSPLPPPMALSTGHSLGHHGRDGGATDQVGAPASRQQPHPRLTELVAKTGPSELVWFRERRGQRLTAHLRADGLIELPSGEIFGDPSAAAQIASRAALHVDGWGVWRLGHEDGPTLHQVVGG